MAASNERGTSAKMLIFLNSLSLSASWITLIVFCENFNTFNSSSIWIASTNKRKSKKSGDEGISIQSCYKIEMICRIFPTYPFLSLSFAWHINQIMIKYLERRQKALKIHNTDFMDKVLAFIKYLFKQNQELLLVPNTVKVRAMNAILKDTLDILP